MFRTAIDYLIPSWLSTKDSTGGSLPLIVEGNREISEQFGQQTSFEIGSEHLGGEVKLTSNQHSRHYLRIRARSGYVGPWYTTPMEIV